jgi:hypothetical protein
MAPFKWLVSVTLAATALPVLLAEPHCPGNVDSVRFRLLERSQIIAPVMTQGRCSAFFEWQKARVFIDGQQVRSDVPRRMG